MFKLKLYTSIFTTTLLLATSTGSISQAQVTSWSAGQNQTEFGVANHWTQGIPGPLVIAAIGPHPNAENGTVFLDTERQLGGLLITDGMILATADNELTIDNLNGGGLTIAGGNIVNDNNWRPSELYVQGGNDGLFDLRVNGNLRVLDGAGLQLRDRGWVRVNDGDITVDQDSTIEGDGFVVFGNNRLNNNGRITSTNGDSIWFTGDHEIAIDLDGDQEMGLLQANHGSELVFAGIQSDAFDGRMEIGSSALIRLEFFETQFGEATLEFNGESMDSAGRLILIEDVQLNSESLMLHATGHGFVEGTLGEDNVTTINGQARIQVDPGGSLTFGEDSVNLATNLSGGVWQVEQDGVLDFKDTLGSTQNIQVQLNGGTILGEDSTVFNNTHPEGIRGFGRFELHFSNTTGITADGGELVVVGSDPFNVDDNLDWDGSNNTGTLRAEAGDLRLVDLFDSTTEGDVRIGGEHQLHIDGFSMTFDGHVLLNSGTIVSEDNQVFQGTVAVPRESTIDSFAAFQEGVNVNLEMDLHLVDHSTFIDDTAMFSGSGDLINEAFNRLVLDGGSFVDVDVINHGIISDENVESPGIVSFGADLENFGTINFALGGVDDFTHFNIEGDLLTNGGIFRVVPVNDFSPVSGNEFDLLDFGAFIDKGFSFDLPELCFGLQWDTSDFATDGILRVTGLLLGDINLDGNVDLLDVAHFVELVSNGVFQAEADINQDGVVNLLDVAQFVDLLNQTCL